MKFDDKLKEYQEKLKLPAVIAEVEQAPGTPTTPPVVGAQPAPADNTLYDVWVVYRSDTHKAAYKAKFPIVDGHGVTLTTSKVASKKTAEEADSIMNTSQRFKI